MKVFPTDINHEYLSDEGCHIIEILNHHQFADISLARARVAQGETTQVHALKDTQEIYYILEGRGEARIGNDVKVLQKGDCTIISPSKSQSIKNVGRGDLIFLCICQPSFQIENYKIVE